MGLLDAFSDPQFRRDLGTNARQLGQSASNTIAEGVTMPIDAVAWLLRRGRVPVPENPVGGSEWAKQMGLMADVPAGAPKIAGETLGLLAPMLGTKQGAAAAAKSLNKMVDNVAATRTMNPQTGAIVWHGSPHKFDKFDASKIGTGEGAQAYGHGLYLAESPDVAKSYLATGQAVKATDRPTEMVARAIDASGGDEIAARSWLQNRLNSSIPEYKELYSSALKGFDSLKPQNSSLYKVDLPDEHIAKMLDWDAPMTGQSELYKQVAKERELPYRGNTPKGGMDIYNSLVEQLGSQQAATDFLKQQGIPGIRYLDGGSRGAGQGSSNFVVFPGNENMLQILERNGQPLGLLK